MIVNLKLSTTKTHIETCTHSHPREMQAKRSDLSVLDANSNCYTCLFCTVAHRMQISSYLSP